MDASPPAYTESPGQYPPRDSAEPPTYNDVHGSTAKDQLPATGELLTLALNSCVIHAAGQPDKPLYELNRPPLNALRGIYTVDKITYRLSTTDGEGTLRQRSRRIYEFFSMFTSSVSVVGKAGPSLCFKDAELSCSGRSWSGCTVSGHFKAEHRRRKNGPRRERVEEIEWKDSEGNVVATEPRDQADRDAPRLEMKMEIDAKKLDLLVTCWMGRVFREALNNGGERLGFRDRSEFSTSAEVVLMCC